MITHGLYPKTSILRHRRDLQAFSRLSYPIALAGTLICVDQVYTSIPPAPVACSQWIWHVKRCEVEMPQQYVYPFQIPSPLIGFLSVHY